MQTGPGNQSRAQYEADYVRKQLLRSLNQFSEVQSRRIKRLLGGYQLSGETRRYRPVDHRSRMLEAGRRKEVLALIYRPGIVNYAHATGPHRPRLDQLDRERQD